MGDQVFEDPGDSGSASAPRSSRLVWSVLTVGLVAGVTAVVLLGADHAVEPFSTSTTQTEAPVVVTTPGAEQDQVTQSGLSVGMTLIVHSDTQGLDIISLPPGVDEADATRDRLPFGVVPRSDLTIDSSGSFVAVQEPLSDEAGSVLYAGSGRSMGMVATNVTGHAWDDEVPGRLVFSIERGGSVEIRGQQSTRVTKIASSRSWAGLRVVAAGPWGIALQDDSPDRLVVLSPHGVFSNTVRGVLLDTSSRGTMLVARGETLYIVDTKGDEQEVLLGQDVREAFAIRTRVGPIIDGILLSGWQSVGVLGEGGVAVVDGPRVKLFDVTPAGMGMESNARYLAFRQAGGGVGVIDLVSGVETVGFGGEDVSTVGFGS